MKAYFDQFQRALDSVIEHDWDDFFVLFTRDAIVKLSMEGLEGDRIADPPTAFADFQASLRRFRHRLTYLGGSQRDCVFSFSAYAQTRLSRDSAMYGGHGYLEFNEDGDIVKLYLYSSDSRDLASAIHAELELLGTEGGGGGVAPSAESFQEVDADAEEVSF